jgi:tetratricopeptide (TPR) repeat protein
MMSASNNIEKYIRQNEWDKAQQVILQELKKYPDNHWLLTRLSTTYYEQKQYKKALKIVESALKQAPKCPLVLWDYAGTLDMLGRQDDAIKIWNALLKLGIDKIACGECGEGLRWARSLLNDARYRIAISYWKQRKIGMAEKFMRLHVENRKPGIPSIYKLLNVRKELSRLQKIANIRK